jgi:predicted PurR-regulated permease PerM
MPYPLLVSVIIAVTAIVPIFGPIFGTIIGAFIILLDAPMQAVWFVVYILVLQQIESNVIYPKIMGKSVSLPGLWVLFAVTTFGGLWGVLGIIVSIPICSVAYTLFDSWLSKRLIERNIANHQYEQEHPKDYDQSFFKFKKKNKAEKQNTDQETDSPCAKDSASEDNN